MQNYLTFVNGSNLFGTFKHLEIFVDDYQSLYRYIFEQAASQWRATFAGQSNPAARLLRVYWYVVDSMDEWDLGSMRSRQYLLERFNEDRDVKARWLAEAGKTMAVRGDASKLEQTAFAMCFDDFRQWYDKKQSILGGMNRFYHAIETSSDFIEIRRCGRWKVDLMHRTITEKGVDVGFAVDMAAFQPSYDVALLIAADPDGIWGLDYVKYAGKQVMAVEFLRGAAPEGRVKPITSRLRLSADCVVPIYEADLLRLGLATKGDTEGFSMRDSEG